MVYNKRFKLTPMPSSNRWRKIYKGKVYYVGHGHCENKDDREGYKIALDEWQTLQEKLDHPSLADPDGVFASALKSLTAPHAYGSHGQPHDDTTEGRPQTIGQAVAEFVEMKRGRMGLGMLSANRVRTIEQHLSTVKTSLGEREAVTTVDDEAAKKYWQSLAARVKAAAIGLTTAHDRWALFGEWVRSLAIPAPKILKSRDYSFPIPRKTVVTWTTEEIKAVIAVMPERFELFMLLMLNCGMYAGDISNLKPSEVDWEKGRIKRRRSKTEHLGDKTPVVDYPLWQRTFALLTKYGHQQGERVFTNRMGLPLVQQHFKENGKMKNQDTIADMYRRTAPAPRKQLKSLRKTGASLLDSHDTYMSCVEHYLAHATKTVTDRHYRNYSQERFDRAIAWLGEQLGI